LFRADGQTYTQSTITKLIVALRKFANAPKNAAFYPYECVDVFRVIVTIALLILYNVHRLA
jgi:hypothetical protein